jgi:bifunctional DNA-binding transcriptional regulator/antitoxin component of YhaV-PrlF toxin-antitoxin module
MSESEIVKMSSKGQLVVPQEIRQIAGLEIGERFVAFPIKEGVVFKRVNMPKISLEFESLSKEIEEQFRKNKVKKKDVKGAVKWARRR